MTRCPCIRTAIVAGWLAVGFLAGPAVLPLRAQASRTPAVPVATMYANAMAEESAVRRALSAAKPPATVLKAVRTAVADFESVVRVYPSSSYCDDALWRAARLAMDAFDLFHESREATTSARLLRLLAKEYPSSRFARQVPAQLKELDTRIAAAAARPAIPAAAVAEAEAPASPPAPVTPAPVTSAPVTSGPVTPAPAAAANAAANTAPAPTAAIKDIRRSVLPDVVRVVIELDREVSFHNERIEGPDRVFVDLSPTRADFNLIDHTLRYDGDTDVVNQIRVGRHPNNVTRVVLDAAGVSSYSVYPLYSPFRLVIDCLREAKAESRLTTTTPSATAPPAAPASTPTTPPTPPIATPTTPANPVPSAPALAAPTLPAPGAARAPIPLSMARQLGLGVSRIVIDPGHGGHDPGAKGKGVTEAELVLDVALRLEKLLLKLEGVEVVLTRRTNDFIPLEERTAIANREGADLFLSIHANASSSPSARGVETYFLDFATTPSAAAVAARENATSAQTMGSLQDVVKAIALNNKLDESRNFAAHVHREMVGTLKSANRNVRDLGVKQAPFVVLIGATMPSVLAEVSFLSNADEARLLKSPAYRQRIAQALLDGIKKYQRSLKPWPSIAQQQD